MLLSDIIKKYEAMLVIKRDIDKIINDIKDKNYPIPPNMVFKIKFDEKLQQFSLHLLNSHLDDNIDLNKLDYNTLALYIKYNMIFQEWLDSKIDWKELENRFDKEKIKYIKPGKLAYHEEI